MMIIIIELFLCNFFIYVEHATLFLQFDTVKIENY